MKILHTADWHLGKLLEGRSRLEEQKIVMIEGSEQWRRKTGGPDRGKS